MMRKTVYYSGRVQGVGFRATTRMLAESFDVTGYVRNMNDGRVEAIIEGERSEIGAFLDVITDRMGRFIESTDMLESPATGDYDDFSIRY
ncbi:MAG: acylphosphatase [Phycisphaera sp.]|nr:acylphosphatase [Phycisphaera sp.]